MGCGDFAEATTRSTSPSASCRTLSTRTAEQSRGCATQSAFVQPQRSGARARAASLTSGTTSTPTSTLYSTDFRRQLKARAMEYEIPIQILRESTLRLDDEATFGERGLTPLSDRAWNIGTALYYKAGGKPWRLNGARKGVCYIGLAYKKRDSDRHSRTAACAAQMFLDSGDGVVFLGEFGPWYSPERRQCHLPAPAATRMLGGVLQTYQTLDGRPLRELFIHCRSGIDEEEFAGIRGCLPAGHQAGRHPRSYRAPRRPAFPGGKVSRCARYVLAPVRA